MEFGIILIPFLYREKQGKIEDGLERIDKETNLQYKKVGELRDLKRNFQINNLAKVNLQLFFRLFY